MWMSLLLLFVTVAATAQEMVAPVTRNPFLSSGPSATKHSTAKKTALSLPFFEDFTDYSLYPNGDRWQDSNVYINNTMCITPVSRGVATFDGLNKYGRPYDTLDPNVSLHADTLTTQPIDLSTHQPGDSIYLSFFYQPQGNGFSPDDGDSLMLFFHKKNDTWQLIWSVNGNTTSNTLPLEFQQVMIPITDTNFFDAAFQFRFINIASMSTNDDDWNLDYIRMDANRNAYDVAVNDVAFTSDPAFILNDYTMMPYRQFLVNPAAELAPVLPDSIRNNYGFDQTIPYTFSATDEGTGTILASANSSSVLVPAYLQSQIAPASYSTTVPLNNPYDRVVFRNQYSLQSTAGEPKANDTIIREQIFDNYLAYDDGSAEESYFLNLYPTLAGNLEIEYHLNKPDTIKGLAIYFGQQVPSAFNKYFSIQVYSALAGVNGATTDAQLYSEDFFAPTFTDTINHFTIYKLATPVPLPTGTFYMGTQQPAESGSDSLYFGLDVNRVGGNHVYYNVLDVWTSSSVSGAIMMRPLLGADVTPTSINEVTTTIATKTDWSFYPNPVTDVLFLQSKEALSSYNILDSARPLCAARRRNLRHRHQYFRSCPRYVYATPPQVPALPCNPNSLPSNNY